ALMRTPPFQPLRLKAPSDEARAIMRGAASHGRELLTEPEAKAVIAAFGIPTVPTRIAASPQEVEAIAEELLQESPGIVTKIYSEDISHKTDVGGVHLGLRTPQEAHAAAE